MKPTEIDMARLAGFGNWVDRVAELEQQLSVAALLDRMDEREDELHEAKGRIAELERQLNAQIADKHRILNEYADRVAELEAQLPEGVKHCTIQFKSCPVGHGRLTATNWTQSECPSCRIAELEADLESLRPISEKHPIAAVKHIGLREIPEAVKQVFAELEAENAKQKAAHAAEAKRWEAEFNQQDAEHAAIHSRLDALGVPACETEVCLECITVVAAGGDSNGCNACHGTGQRPVACRITARLDWVAAQLAGPGGTYGCGCSVEWSDKIKAFCPVHCKMIEQEAKP